MKASDFPIIVDHELQLELRSLNNAHECYAVIERNHAYLKKFLSWLDDSSLQKTIDYTKASIEKFNANIGLDVVIVYQGTIVGAVGFHAIDWRNKTTTVGYWLSEDAQGKGIMTRACKALFDYGFTTLHLHKIEIHVMPSNSKSAGIPQRLGFTLEGRLRDRQWLYDHYEDHLVYGMLSNEWKKKQ
jgi:ribosomal-protein-serine acetyltransferase